MIQQKKPVVKPIARSLSASVIFEASIEKTTGVTSLKFNFLICYLIALWSILGHPIFITAFYN